MTVIAPTDFTAQAISSSQIQLECTIPEETTQFDWQYTLLENPESSDWVTFETVDLTSLS